MMTFKKLAQSLFVCLTSFSSITPGGDLQLLSEEEVFEEGLSCCSKE
jgi:hypothetical protein